MYNDLLNSDIYIRKEFASLVNKGVFNDRIKEAKDTLDVCPEKGMIMVPRNKEYEILYLNISTPEDIEENEDIYGKEYWIHGFTTD